MKIRLTYRKLYGEDVPVVQCLECKQWFYLSYHYEEDRPGFRWPSDCREIQFPCGHPFGNVDVEHTTIHFTAFHASLDENTGDLIDSSRFS